MKKILALALAGAGAVLVRRSMQQSKTEQALWAEATDSVRRS